MLSFAIKSKYGKESVFTPFLMVGQQPTLFLLLGGRRLAKAPELASCPFDLLAEESSTLVSDSTSLKDSDN